MARLVARLTSIALFTPLIPAGAFAAQLKVQVLDDDKHPVANAVVAATPVEAHAAGKPRNEVIDQIDKEFVPPVKAIYVGSTVSFPNHDNIRHHVYSLSPAKTFQLPLYAGTSSKTVLFDKPGVVVLGCNIHDWMVGYVYVADTPYFSMSGPDGSAALDNLPAGEYLVKVWHPRLVGGEDDDVRRLRIDAAASAATWTIKLQPAFTPPRAHLPGAHGYQ